MARQAVLVVVAVVVVTFLAVGLVAYCGGFANRNSNTVVGSFSYFPVGQVKVDRVWANMTQASNGRENVTFWVTFENTGSSPVYAIGGWVGALTASISGNSLVIQEAPSKLCVAATYLVTLKQGQNATAYAPDCASGFNYQLVHSGGVAMVMSFNWTTNGKENTPFSNSTTIQANFNFS